MTTGEKIAAEIFKSKWDRATQYEIATLIDTELEKNAQRAAETIAKKFFGDSTETVDRATRIRDIILNP